MALFLIAWTALSFPVGMLVGRWIRGCRERDGFLADLRDPVPSATLAETPARPASPSLRRAGPFVHNAAHVAAANTQEVQDHA